MTTPRRKRFNRTQRLQSARAWVPTYEGHDLVKGYRKWYGVDTVTAILELRQLGIRVPDTRLTQAKETERQACARSAAKKVAVEDEDSVLAAESDETLAYIAGYTLGGAPYGVTWAEIEASAEESFEDPSDCDE